MVFLRYILFLVCISIGYGQSETCTIDHGNSGINEYPLLFNIKDNPKPNKNLNKKLYELIDEIGSNYNFDNTYCFVNTSVLNTVETYSTSKLINALYFVTHKEFSISDSQILSLEYINEYPILALSDQKVTQIFITPNDKYYDFILTNGTHVMSGFSVLQSLTWKTSKYDHKLKVHYAPGYIGGLNLGESIRCDVDIVITNFYKILKFSADVRLYKSENNNIKIAHVNLEHSEQFLGFLMYYNENYRFLYSTLSKFGYLMYILSSIFHGVYLICGMLLIIAVIAPIENRGRNGKFANYTLFKFAAYIIIFVMSQVQSKNFYDALKYYFSYGFSGVLNSILLVEAFIIYAYFTMVTLFVPVVFDVMGVNNDMSKYYTGAVIIFNSAYFGIWYILHAFGFTDFYDFLCGFTNNPNIYYALLSSYIIMIPLGAIYKGGIWSHQYWTNLAITAYGLIYPILDFGPSYYTKGFYDNAWIYILINIITTIILKIQTSYGGRFFLPNDKRITSMDSFTKTVDHTEFDIHCDLGLNLLGEDSLIYLKNKPTYLLKKLKKGQYYILTCTHMFHYNCLGTAQMYQPYFYCPLGNQYHDGDFYLD